MENNYKTPEIYFESDKDEVEAIDDFGLTQAQRDDLIKRAKKASSEAHAYWDDKYEKMEEDWKIYSGDQWTESAKATRGTRPTLTINQLPKFVKRIVAQTKQEPPSVKLNPRESNDRLKADIGMGLVRYIEDTSGAKYAYAHALECAVIGGLGWIKGTFDADKKKIILKKVRDPFFYMIDPDSEEIDGSDAKFFIAHTKKKDGKKSLDCYEYWFKEDDKVYWAIIKGSEIEDYGEFPGEIIPIFPVFGEEICFRDERIIKGIIRDLTDPQRTYNYIKSQEVEIIALTPKAPVIAEEGTLDGYEGDWKRASKTPVDILYFKRTNLANQDSTPPQFANTQPNVQWAPQITQGAQNDLREISGIYDTNLGAGTTQMSGKAIIAKQEAGDAGQLTYTEHLQASIQQIGRWILGMINPIMGEETSIRILGEDGKQSVVDTATPQIDPVTGAPVMLDLDFSEMDISVSSAPAYATRREASSKAMQEIMSALPNSAQFIADIAVRNLDLPGAEEAANRLYKMLPPNLQESTEQGTVPQAIADQMMQASEATIQQQQQVIQQMQAQLQSLQFELQNQTQAKLAEQQMESQTTLAVTEIKEQGANQRKIMELQAQQQANAQELQQLLLKEQGANQRKMAEITSKAQIESQKIAVSTIAAQQPIPVVPEAPKSVTVNNTTVTNNPLPRPNPIVFRENINNPF